jgi:hypothetical protein
MNNIEAYNTELGNGAPFETLETFQDTAVPPVATPPVVAPTPVPEVPQYAGGSPMCTNGYGPNREGLCEDGATPGCMTGETLNASSGMCEVAATTNPNTTVVAPVTADPMEPINSPNTAPAAPDPTAVAPPVEDPAVTAPIPPVETFIGTNSVDMDLLLRALVFGCLFFILAHNDTRKMLVNSSILRSLNLKAGDDNSLLILMGVFVIAYLVLTRYVL